MAGAAIASPVVVAVATWAGVVAVAVVMLVAAVVMRVALADLAAAADVLKVAAADMLAVVDMAVAAADMLAVVDMAVAAADMLAVVDMAADIAKPTMHTNTQRRSLPASPLCFVRAISRTVPTGPTKREIRKLSTQLFERFRVGRNSATWSFDVHPS
jgi:hypothetical protein